MNATETRVFKEYARDGYDVARKLLNKMSIKREIAVVQRAAIANKLATFELMSSKERRRKLKKLGF